MVHAQVPKVGEEHVERAARSDLRPARLGAAETAPAKAASARTMARGANMVGG